MIAERIAAAGNGTVRRVVMIGSRARGTPRPDSDLDLVVVVEPPDLRAWSGADCAIAAKSFRPSLGPLPLKLDLWVRTVDRFAEAGDVPGGVEHEATHCGFTVFETRSQRAPVVRTSPENVRRELVGAWMHHAILALETGPAMDRRTEPHVARFVGERLLTALLVHHRCAPQPFESPGERARRVPIQARRLAEAVAQLAGNGATRRSAVQSARDVLRYLERDALQAGMLRRAAQRLAALESG